MASLPFPDPHREADFVTSRVDEGYRKLPVEIAWVVFPLAGALIAGFCASSFALPIPFLLAAVGLIAGILLAARLVREMPAQEVVRLERFREAARKDFHQQFAKFLHEYDGFSQAVDEFALVTRSKSYRLYVKHANAALRKKPSRKDWTLFYREIPQGVSELVELLFQSVAAVEMDSSAVTAYAPHLLERIAYLQKRAEVGNILDCYRAATDLETLLNELRGRHEPFDFADTVSSLSEQVQSVRDQFLADPRREALWREIQHRDEQLRERRRHNEAIEEAAEAEAEAAQRAAEAEVRQANAADEENVLRRQQRNADYVVAAASTATAVYARKTAKATEELARQGRRPSSE